MMQLDLSECWSDFVDLWLPRLCVGCSRTLVKGEPEICSHCRVRIDVSSSFNAPQENELMDRLKGRLLLSHGMYYTWFRKGGVLQPILHALKYEGRSGAGVLLGNWIGHELRKRMIHLEFNALVPVPVHKSRLRQRGYNQSDMIAQGIGEVTGIPVVPMLVKEEAKGTQTKLGRWQRWINSTHAFRCESQLPVGTRILLIDDVVTTGSTVEACCQPLFASGAEQVGLVAAALAR
ncbi:MAG: ComF family protein [Cytophagaceae bacterium]|jgi:ComF family protein|nr:ComF family protein [Cytophagaceae bacterium]